MVPVISPSGLAGAVLLLLVRSGEQARFGSAGYSGERKKEEEQMDKKIVGEFKNDGEYCLSYEDLFGRTEDTNFADYEKHFLVRDGVVVAEREKFSERFEDVEPYVLEAYDFHWFLPEKTRN